MVASTVSAACILGGVQQTVTKSKPALQDEVYVVEWKPQRAGVEA